MQKVIFILMSLFFVSCKDIIKDTPQKILNDTSIKQAVKPVDLESSDSLGLLKILDSSLAYAKKHQSSDFYKRNYEEVADEASFIVTVQMLYGHLFSNDRKHLLIKREVPWATYLTVYLLQGDDFKLVVDREQKEMTYIDDTSKDVDGDGYKDFLVHWYPSSGCCLANVYNVYLYQPQAGNFTGDYEFINPTFLPKEKMILGLRYGHPGEAGLYKYKWNGLKVDTLEFVYPCFDKKGAFIKTTKQDYRPTEKDGIMLNALPKEYLRINSNELKWFFDKY